MIRVYLDIETAPSEDRPKDSWVGDVKVGNRGAEKAAEYRASKADDAWRKTSLDTVFFRVLCVGIAVADQPPVCVMEDTEEATLRAFAARLQKLDEYASGKSEPLQFITHNGLAFDLPGLCRRMLRYSDGDAGSDLNQASQLLWCGRKWGDYQHIDTMIAWQGACRLESGRARLNTICEHLGISREDNPCDGSEVFDKWQAAELDAISGHVLDDVRVLRMVHLRLLAAGMCE